MGKSKITEEVKIELETTKMEEHFNSKLFKAKEAKVIRASLNAMKEKERYLRKFDRDLKRRHTEFLKGVCPFKKDDILELVYSGWVKTRIKGKKSKFQVKEIDFIITTFGFLKKPEGSIVIRGHWLDSDQPWALHSHTIYGNNPDIFRKVKKR